MKLKYDKKREVFTIIESNRTEYHQTKLHLTRKVKGFQFTPQFKLGVWDGTISHFKDGEFALGLWKEIFGLCKMNDWEFNVINKKDVPLNRTITYEDVENFCKEFFKDHTLPNGTPFMPYDHQIESAYGILKNQFCLTEVATGGGKSLIFGIICFYILHNINKDTKFLLLVPNISLVTQFYDDLINYNEGFKGGTQNKTPLELKMCEIMSDKPRRDEGECNVFIGTVQSLEKRPKKWFSQFDIVASDESHKSGSGNSKKVKQVAKVLGNTFGHAKMRFGMSGTYPEENSIDWLTIQSLHGPAIAKVEAKELIKKGIISSVNIKALIFNHNDIQFNNDLAMIKSGGNGKACFDLERKYIHESEPRLKFVTEKLLSKVTKNTLVLFNIKDYGKKIFNRIKDECENVDVYYIDGDTKKDAREKIKKLMEKSSKAEKIAKILKDDTIKPRPKILVASFGTLSTGVSIKNLHNLIFMESFKSEQLIIQSVGRLLRLHKNKTNASVFDIVDVFDDRTKSKNILYKHFEERKRFYTKREYPFTELKIKLR